MGRSLHGRWSVDELPRVSPVEAAHSYRRRQAGVEVSKVDTVLCAWRRGKRLPMRYAATRVAANRSKGLVAPDVFGGSLGMAFDFYRPKLVVHPQATNAAAERAVAVSGDLGRVGQSQAYGTAVA